MVVFYKKETVLGRSTCYVINDENDCDQNVEVDTVGGSLDKICRGKDLLALQKMKT